MPGIGCASHFQDQSTVKSDALKGLNDLAPRDAPIAGREMIVAVSAIVVGMDHPEMPGQFVD